MFVCRCVCMSVCMCILHGKKKMYEECEHIVITLNHLKTTIFMYND